jgi:pyruvate kinase
MISHSLHCSNADLIAQMESLRRALVQHSEQAEETVRELPPGGRQSAENLLHYLALRRMDLRPLQDQLARLGLSSLGRAEPHVLATVDAVLHQLYLASGTPPNQAGLRDVGAAFDAGAELLEQNTRRLLGQHPQKRRGSVIVTMPAIAADDYRLVHQLLEYGMNVMRINCAHDDAEIWLRIIHHLHSAERATGLSCRVLMELAGPKLRTGPMEAVPAALKIRPRRGTAGQLLRPAHVWLRPAADGRRDASAADVSLDLEPGWLAQIKAGDTIHFRDARASRRIWVAREVSGDGCWAAADKTAYVTNGTVLHLHRSGRSVGASTIVRDLPSRESVILVRTGDALILSASEEPGTPAYIDESGKLLGPGRISLAIAEVFRDARQGELVCFDDGRVTGMIDKLGKDQLQLRITHTRKPVEKLASNKGVNFPDTSLDLPALGDRDLRHLEFAARHADIVGLSFVNGPRDVRALRHALQQLGREDIGVIMKIETRRGFACMTETLLEALKFQSCGVMIARGDLAVECGFERLAEVQEEIMWLCEAAHLPVIWATQVLENLLKRGHATRAEITDAAMAQAAEGVMLNKGPHVLEAVKTLDDILQRMQGHHHKKRSMLRSLHLAVGG